jgi:hypothetical protein
MTYIFPHHGAAIKLAHVKQCYRLLQIPSMDTYVNVEICEVIDDKYGLSQIFVYTGGKTLTIDLEPGIAVLSRTDLPWVEEDVRTEQNNTGLLQGTYQVRTVQIGLLTLEVRIFLNAQISNQIIVCLQEDMCCPTDTSGLLYHNYRPTLFRISYLEDSEEIDKRIMKKLRSRDLYNGLPRRSVKEKLCASIFS